MQAEILSVGTELLLGEITDTNAQYISARLKDLGIDVFRRTTIGDNPSRLTACFKEALGRADIVIASGGLGPTDDDVTATCLAAALDRPLQFSEVAWNGMMEWFQRRNRIPAGSDRKQAMVAEGGLVLKNRLGTAPGQAVSWDGKLAAVLPGPPREMIPMFEDELVPLLKERFPGLTPLESRDLRLVNIAESKAGEALHDLMESSNPTLAPYVGTMELRLRIAAKAGSHEEAREMISRVEGEVRRRLADHIFGADGDTLESACGRLLEKRGLTLAIAESVTGGLVAHRITLVPGSSRYFKMGIVAYHPGIKVSCLGVPRDDAERNQAVNADVARSMAHGIRALAGAKIGLATTGFAGPDGGTPEEPVGTIYSAVAYEGGFRVDRQVYPGSRANVKQYAAQRALIVLWDHLRDRSGGG